MHALEAKPADASLATLDDGTELFIRVVPLDYAKCVRCWHFLPDVGTHANHPELCGRCVTNIEGPGEVRKHA